MRITEHTALPLTHILIGISALFLSNAVLFYVSQLHSGVKLTPVVQNVQQEKKEKECDNLTGGSPALLAASTAPRYFSCQTVYLRERAERVVLELGAVIHGHN